MYSLLLESEFKEHIMCLSRYIICSQTLFLFTYIYFNHYNQTFDIFTSDNAPLKIKKATNRYLMQQDESPDNPVSDTIEKNHRMQHQGSHSLLRGLAEDDEKVNICHYTSGSGYNLLFYVLGC